MEWEQKYDAMRALVGWDGISLRMRQIGNWYVHCCAEISDGSMLRTPTQSANTPRDAVETMWAQYTILKEHEHVFTRAGGDERRVRWNGYMWANVLRREEAYRE